MQYEILPSVKKKIKGSLKGESEKNWELTLFPAHPFKSLQLEPLTSNQLQRATPKSCYWVVDCGRSDRIFILKEPLIQKILLFKSGKVKTYNVWPKVALFTHFLPFSPKHQLYIRIYIRITIPYLLIYVFPLPA